MTRKHTSKSKEVNEASERDNGTNKTITITTIKSVFEETFKQQEQVLIEAVKSASTITNVIIHKLSTDITKNNEKLTELSEEVSDVQISIDASQEIMEKKIEALEQKIDKEKKLRYLLQKKNKELEKKLQDVEGT